MAEVPEPMIDGTVMKPAGKTWCTCGHHRSKHGPRGLATAFCVVQTCRCRRFESAATSPSQSQSTKGESR